MKYNFIFTVSGEELEKKIQTAVNDNQKLHRDFINHFGQSLVKNLKLNPKDEIAIECFRAIKIDFDYQKEEVQKNDKPKKQGIFKAICEYVMKKLD